LLHAELDKVTEPLSPAVGSRHLPALDVLRGAAILAVIWHHLFILRFPAGWWFQSNSPAAFLGTWASNGWLGVSLFFILSGFVLYWPFATQIRTLDSWSQVVDFYKRRGRRLLPLYFFGVFVLLGLTAKPDLFSLVTLLTFTFNFHKETFFPGVNWVLWSLGIEFWFSLIFPLLVLAIAKYGLFRTAVVVFAVAIGTRAIGLHLPQANFMGNPSLNIVANSVLGRLDDFFVGMALAALYARGSRIAAPAWMFSLGLVVLTLTGILHDLLVTGGVARVAGVFEGSLCQVGAAIVIMAALSIEKFRLYPLELLGLMCYSLYFWHGVVMSHTVSSPQTDGLLKFTFVLTGLAWLSYRYIEHSQVKELTMLLPRR
jgi:peptidoglycan/LPS O-acetylase OafA/YrhL